MSLVTFHYSTRVSECLSVLLFSRQSAIPSTSHSEDLGSHQRRAPDLEIYRKYLLVVCYCQEVHTVYFNVRGPYQLVRRRMLCWPQNWYKTFKNWSQIAWSQIAKKSGPKCSIACSQVAGNVSVSWLLFNVKGSSAPRLTWCRWGPRKALCRVGSCLGKMVLHQYG